MRLLPVVGLLVQLVVFPYRADAEEALQRDASAARKLGWELASKGYTFRNITLSEAIAITHSLGVSEFEMNPTQKLSPEHPVNTDQTLSPELRAALRQQFADAGVRPVNFGVIKLTKDEEADRKIFQFAKEMGIGTLVSEPDPAAFDLLDKLCEEYGVNVAIHNHPAPSRYWNPDTILESIRGHSARIGACADVGHWTRSGLDTVECLRKLEGHVLALHFKDVNVQKEDVPWGTGKCNVPGMLEELRRQGYRGAFSMEYESKASLPQLIGELRQSVLYFDAQIARLPVKG